MPLIDCSRRQSIAVARLQLVLEFAVEEPQLQCDRTMEGEGFTQRKIRDSKTMER